MLEEVVEVDGVYANCSKDAIAKFQSNLLAELGQEAVACEARLGACKKTCNDAACCDSSCHRLLVAVC